MMSGKSVLDEKWLGTEQEERDNIVTEVSYEPATCSDPQLLYIHSKLMIVDDRRVICGSANLNDRSLNGNHDSEIAIVIEDTDMVEMTMNGKKYMASRLATTWRRTLMREHLGLLPPQSASAGVTNGMKAAPVTADYDFGSEPDRLVEDPLSIEFTRLWTETAHTNRMIFDRIFRTTPNEVVRSWKQYNEYIKRNTGILVGHVANPDMSLLEIKTELSKIRGHLVNMPLYFMADEKAMIEGGDWMSVNPVTLAIYI
jgi:phospholipase D1/2